MEQPTPSLKPFAVWVTGLTDKYRFDPNVRTTSHIILLQVGLTLLSILVFGWAIEYAQTGTVGSIAAQVAQVVAGATTSPGALPQSIADVREQTYTYVFVGLILLNAIFGYLIASFALRPTRQTLSFQKRFIGNVAHEIRTPLSIIKTSTEVALFDSSLPDDARRTLLGTIVELDRISETINNLLSFDSLTRPQTMRRGVADLGAIATTVVERHQELAASRGIALSCKSAPELVVEGNATALDQVVTNLLKNAINYTPDHKGGAVTLTVLPSQFGTVVLTVTDTGIGIDAKDLYHVFEPFYRADTSRARGVGTGSSGLGLAIVNEIVRLHHGSITVRSTLGKGTSVRVSLPAKMHRSASPLAPSLSEDDYEMTLDFS